MQDDRSKARGAVADSASTDGHGGPRRKDDRREVERRSYTRFPVTASVEAVELLSKARFTGRTADLGIGGCYIDTISPLPIGVSVKMRLTWEGKSFETKAKIVTSAVGMGMGVMFMAPEPEQLQILEGWIGELSGEGQQSEPDLPAIGNQPQTDAAADSALSGVVNELIDELMGAGVLSKSKGAAIQQKLRAGRGRG